LITFWQELVGVDIRIKNQTILIAINIL